MKKQYKYRNYPCTVGAWYVQGIECLPNSISAGILEWCESEADAKAMLELMKTCKQFTNLSIGNCTDETGIDSLVEEVTGVF